MQITRGKIPCAKKTVIYGPEGIGKSTFASMFPDPVFIDTEGSTKDMDVARLPAPSSWDMVMEEVRYAAANPHIYRTLAVDTADWAETLCARHICDKYQKTGIEDFGYGKGYTFLQEEFGRFLNLLEELAGKGVHVVLNAHAKMRKFEQPDEMGAYDRWEMKLSKQVAPIVKEWADMVLFANYKTRVVKVDGRNKAQGGARVMYTAHHSCWDAKNRYGLPEELPFEYGAIAHIISGNSTASQTDSTAQAAYVQQPVYTETEPVPGVADKSIPGPEKEIPSAVPGKDLPDVSNAQEAVPEGQQMSLPFGAEDGCTGGFTVDQRIPKQLRDLMILYQVTEWEVESAVESKHYVPMGTPIWEYETVNPGLLDGVLVADWIHVYEKIKEIRESEEIPFN